MVAEFTAAEENQRTLSLAERVRMDVVKLMIVDDDRLTSKVVAKHLAEAGYSDLTIGDPAHALQLIARVSPDILLLNLNMPGVNGFELLAQLGTDEHLRDIIVVMISAADDDATRLRAAELGAFDFLSKPVDAAKLVETVGRAAQEICRG